MNDARHRPQGRPIMHQNWGKLLFIHWPIDQEVLRPRIPPALKLDTFENSAWIAITPFTMWDVRLLPPFVPAVPGLDSMHELNVRTYVEHQGTAGVWFFSLDINSHLAAIAARTLYYLPYYTAAIRHHQTQTQIDYDLKRHSSSQAQFSASWIIGDSLPISEPGSLEYFLTERYCLFAEHKGNLYRARIYHQPWPLRQATLRRFDSDILQADNLYQPQGDPIVHYSEEVNVDIWFREQIS